MNDRQPADRRKNPHHHEEAIPTITEIEKKVVTEDRLARRRAVPWAALAVVGLIAFGALTFGLFDTRSVATGSTACSRGDMNACRASADRIANACSYGAIVTAVDRRLAKEQCQNLARALEPLQGEP